MKSSFTSRDIIEVLDEDARSRAPSFPDLAHGYNYHIDARLSAYGDDRRWAIVIEQSVVNPRWGSFAGVGVHIHYHGNCIDLPPEDSGKRKYDVLYIPNLISDGPSGSLLVDSFSEEISPAAKDVCIRGTAVPIRTDENYYWARTIDVKRLTKEDVQKWIEVSKDHL